LKLSCLLVAKIEPYQSRGLVDHLRLVKFEILEVILTFQLFGPFKDAVYYSLLF
jgi:hypothetical protein